MVYKLNIGGIPVTVLSDFTAGIQGSLSASLSPSGGDWCSNSCRAKRQRWCYATACEARKPKITIGLERKQADLTSTLQALLKHSKVIASAPWFRLSVFGSVPPRSARSATDDHLLTELASRLDHGRVHLPVEDMEKYHDYSAMGYRPRLSLQNRTLRTVKRYLGLGYRVSLTVGDRDGEGWTLRNKVKARHAAKQLRRADTSVVVCPKVLGTSKCGRCTACADTRVAAVIYPMHQ